MMGLLVATGGSSADASSAKEPPPAEKSGAAQDKPEAKLSFAQAVAHYERRFHCKVFFPFDFQRGQILDQNRLPPAGQSIAEWIEFLSQFVPLSRPVRIDALNDLILTSQAQVSPGLRMNLVGMVDSWPWYSIPVRLPLVRWHEIPEIGPLEQGAYIAEEHALACRFGESFGYCSRAFYYDVLRRETWFGFRSGALWGFKDRSGRQRIEPQWMAVQPFRESRAAAQSDGKWGLIDEDGKWRSKPSYDQIRESYDGRCAAARGGRWGFIDRDGKEVVPPIYRKVDDFSERIAAVREKGKWGYLDRDGKMVAPFRFEYAQAFSEGFGGVLFEGKWGYLDRKGEWAIPPRFKWGSAFSDGYAFVLNETWWAAIDVWGQYSEIRVGH